MGLKDRGVNRLAECSEDELMNNVKGIGKVLAERIVGNVKKDWTWEDVEDLRGIGSSRLNALRIYIHKKHQITMVFARPGKRTLYSSA